MPNTVKQLAQAATTTSATTIYTAPAATKALIESIVMVNTTTTTKKVRIHFVPSGGAVGTGNAIVYDMPLDLSGVPYVLHLKQVIETGGTIRVLSDVVGVTITVSGIEVS